MSQMKLGNPLRALSLTQPWATLIVRGSKMVETRSWATNFRGEVAIHASKGFTKGELIHIRCCWNFCGALGIKMGTDGNLWNTLPFGAIVGVAVVTGCRPTGNFRGEEIDIQRGESPYQWTERQMGCFDIGRFGFELSNVRAIDPVPCKGALGFWTVPDDVTTLVRSRLEF